jgi:hypothetical protein
MSRRILKKKKKKKFRDVMLFIRVFQGFGPKIVGILPGRAVLRAQHPCCCVGSCAKSRNFNLKQEPRVREKIPLGSSDSQQLHKSS